MTKCITTAAFAVVRNAAFAKLLVSEPVSFVIKNGTLKICVYVEYRDEGDWAYCNCCLMVESDGTRQFETSQGGWTCGVA